MINTLIQFRVENKVKKDATKLYNDLGLDLNTAINLFLKKSIKMQKLPFSINDEMEEDLDIKIKAFKELDNMNLNIKKDIDYKEELYKGIKAKYESIN